MKSRVIHNEVFDVSTLFIYDCDTVTANRKLRKIGATELEGDEVGAVLKAKNGNHIVYFRSLEDKSAIVHELFHLVLRICEDRAIPVQATLENGEHGDETAAYMIDFYVRKLLTPPRTRHSVKE